MKCPKCGYNSFEYLDSCKKCNADLAGFKAAHGIRPMILPAVALVSGGIGTEQLPEYQTVPIEPTLQESDDFSWDDSAEEQKGETGALPALGLDLAPEEPDHFNFSLDLAEPEAAPEPTTAEELPFDGFGTEGNDFFLQSDLPKQEDAVQTSVEEPKSQEETPFGELSFDDLYSEQEPAATPATPAADEALPDFFGAADVSPAAEPMPDEAFGDLLEIERNADGTAADETAGVFDANPFRREDSPPEETPVQEERGDGEVDLMGLSPEEYESLFGEPPAKKKAASSTV